MSDSTAAEAPTTEGGVRPPLKWAGGKRWLLPHLEPLWRPQRHRRLVEPLCGGLAVALGLRPERALLNDINPHAINLYEWLKRGLRITIPMRNESELYYQHRDRFNELITKERTSTAEAASLFYFLNRTGYNGLCRFNQQGLFNVPFGRYTRINYLRDFTSYREVLAGWTFTCGDFEKIKLDPEDFVYADPPYDVEFTQYAKEGFTWDDQVRLAEWLAHHRGPVALSNQATPRITKLYAGLGFKSRYLKAPRRISCTGDRSDAREVLATRGLAVPLVVRDTTTGAVLERMVLPALTAGGYRYEIQAPIGRRLGGGRHIVDVIARNGKAPAILVSLKWQQTGGTAEQKVPFEVICLAQAIRESEGRFGAAYVVLGGEGWTLRKWYTEGGLDEHLRPHAQRVKVMSLEAFVAAANRGML